MKSTRYYSDKQETFVAKKLGGRKQINSGATPFYKGDVIMENVLIECKTTTTPKLSFSIKKEWLKKLESERISMRKNYSALVFGFEPNGVQYCVISLDLFNKFIKMEKTLMEEE